MLQYRRKLIQLGSNQVDDNGQDETWVLHWAKTEIGTGHNQNHNLTAMVSSFSEFAELAGDR